jgi:hypothetical protein
MTGSNRTRINHDWDDLSTAEQVWAALEYEEPDSYGRKERSFANLKAAIDIACKDALSLNWLRTLEQVEGGAFPGPWLKLHSRKQAEDFLIEYDAARASPISCNKMKVQVRALIESLRLLSPTAFDALLGQIARTHNYTQTTMSQRAPIARQSLPPRYQMLRKNVSRLRRSPRQVHRFTHAQLLPSPRLPYVLWLQLP